MRHLESRIFPGVDLNIRLLQRAFLDHGLEEIPGKESNSKILSMIQWLLPWATDDSTTAWCGIWMAKVFDDLKLPIPEHPYRARSWLSVGDALNLKSARPGDLVVFWRGAIDGDLGHVGFYLDHDDKYVYTWGGNQSNRVGIKPYPIHRVLAIRRVNYDNVSVA